MRNSIPLMIAVALTAATPAAAQVTDNAANADTTAMAANDVAVTDNMVANDAMTAAPANDMMAVPVTADETVATDYGAPAPAKKSGFPWGVLGLVGLLGLIPRKARSNG